MEGHAGGEPTGSPRPDCRAPAGGTAPQLQTPSVPRNDTKLQRRPRRGGAGPAGPYRLRTTSSLCPPAPQLSLPVSSCPPAPRGLASSSVFARCLLPAGLSRGGGGGGGFQLRMPRLFPRSYFYFLVSTSLPPNAELPVAPTCALYPPQLPPAECWHLAVPENSGVPP